MDHAFWTERWQRGEIGFHQAEINPLLQTHWPRLGVPVGSWVFVPLAGKTRDMVWLSECGHPVVGVELSAVAVDDFYTDAGLTPEVVEHGRFRKSQANGITLLTGDVFDLAADDLKDVAAVYDRASLIAVRPAMRARYAGHLAQVLKPGVVSLLIAISYPQHQMSGPPFSVSKDEVHAIFAPGFTVEELESRDSLSASEQLRSRGVTELETTVYRLTRRA